MYLYVLYIYNVYIYIFIYMYLCWVVSPENERWVTVSPFLIVTTQDDVTCLGDPFYSINLHFFSWNPKQPVKKEKYDGWNTHFPSKDWVHHPIAQANHWKMGCLGVQLADLKLWWWFHHVFLIFTPIPGEIDSHFDSYFSSWVGSTTNQNVSLGQSPRGRWGLLQFPASNSIEWKTPALTTNPTSKEPRETRRRCMGDGIWGNSTSVLGMSEAEEQTSFKSQVCSVGPPTSQKLNKFGLFTQQPKKANLPVFFLWMIIIL